jgi:hypothetical protein
MSRTGNSKRFRSGRSRGFAVTAAVDEKAPEPQYGIVTDPDGWVELTSYHHERGNDSMDSHECHDVCSFECYVAVMRTLYEQNHDYPSADGKDLRFLEAPLAFDNHASEYVQRLV